MIRLRASFACTQLREGRPPQRRSNTLPKLGHNAVFVATLIYVIAGAHTVALAQVDELSVEDAVRTHDLDPFSPVKSSPDGKWLVYLVPDREIQTTTLSSVFHPGADIWLSNTVTGDVRNLTNGKGENWLPEWSPDGRFLAFVSDCDGKGQPRLWVWDTTKSTLRKVADANVKTWPMIEWAPDSKGIFVTLVPGGSSLEHFLERLQSDATSNRDIVEKAQGSTVRLYRSSGIGQRNEEISQTDPWNLNLLSGDLARIDIVTGQTKTLVPDRRIATYRLSPDGSRIAYTISKRFKKAGSFQELFDLAVTNIATNEEKVVASNLPLHIGGAAFSWSPDGTLLSYHIGGWDEKVNDCYVVAATGGPPRPRNITHLLPRQGIYRLSSAPLWEKSGHYIYFVHNGALWQASVSRNEASEVARIPNHQIEERLLQQFNSLLLTIDDGTSTVVVAHDDVGKQDGFYKVNLTSGKSVQLLENGQCYTCLTPGYPFSVTANGQRIVYLAEDAQHGSDLWVSDVGFNNPRRLTHLNPQFDKYKLGVARLIDWLSDDGERLHGALLLPSDHEEGKRYPLVVGVYGAGLLSNSFDSFGFTHGSPMGMNMQLLATRGYAVLLPDSPSHEEGTPMADLAKTVLPGVNKVIEMGVADPERLGVMGHSNGGYSTLALIVQTKRFKVAVDMDGSGDFVGAYGAMGKDGTAFGIGSVESKVTMGGTPWQYRERYVENSPFFYLDRVETPLLIVHVAGDPAVASFLGDQVFVGLRRLRKEVEYAKYEGESHSPSGYADNLDCYSRVLAWFDKYLKATSY